MRGSLENFFPFVSYRGLRKVTKLRKEPCFLQVFLRLLPPLLPVSMTDCPLIGMFNTN